MPLCPYREMPKKFQGENTKAVEARNRKAAAKAAKRAQDEQEREDARWADDDKLGNRKAQRKVCSISHQL